MNETIKPKGATHIDNQKEYWKVISEDECYFFRHYEWIRYILTLDVALKKFELSPI